MGAADAVVVEGLDEVTVDGEPVTPELSEMDSVAMLDLPSPLEEEDIAIINIAFTTNVPVPFARVCFFTSSNSVNASGP